MIIIQTHNVLYAEYMYVQTAYLYLPSVLVCFTVNWKQFLYYIYIYFNSKNMRALINMNE